ncbi:MAG: hypothetical protein AABX51_09105, partial [Nanoarchaeota archaeon]
MLGKKFPFIQKKEQPKPKKELPGLAHGILHKEAIAHEVPDRLPSITSKSKESHSLVEEKPFFSEHKVESVFQSPETKAEPREVQHRESDASFFAELSKHLNAEEELIRKKLSDPQGLLNRN